MDNSILTQKPEAVRTDLVARACEREVALPTHYDMTHWHIRAVEWKLCVPLGGRHVARHMVDQMNLRLDTEHVK